MNCEEEKCQKMSGRYLLMKISNLTLCCPGYPEIPTRIPCSVYSALYEAGKIPDPFYADNAERLSKLSDKGCLFYSEFTLKEEDIRTGKLMLRCSGIDTLCGIFLNGKKIGDTDNFHRTWCFMLGDKVKTGINRLEFRFRSPTEFMKEAQERHWLWGEEHPMEEGYLHTTSGIGHIRKPSYMFGWDWGVSQT